MSKINRELLHILEVLALFGTVLFAFLSWREARATLEWTKKEMLQRNRPFLTFNIDTAQMLQTKEQIENSPHFEFVMVIKNHGSVPAYNVNHYAIGVADDVGIFSTNLPASLPQSLKPRGFLPFEPGRYSINDLKNYSVKMNEIVPAGSESEFRFTVSKQSIQSLLAAKDKAKSGLTLRVDYTGLFTPSDNFFYQETILPWFANNRIQYVRKNMISDKNSQPSQ